MAEKPLSWLFVCMMWAGPVWGYSVAPNVDCPTQFRGIAKEVKEPEGATHALSKQKVVFQVDHVIKGLINGDQEIELLKFGPTVIELGKQYLIQLKQNRLCWIEKLE